MTFSITFKKFNHYLNWALLVGGVTTAYLTIKFGVVWL
jgi:hypothetical protein